MLNNVQASRDDLPMRSSSRSPDVDILNAQSNFRQLYTIASMRWLFPRRCIGLSVQQPRSIRTGDFPRRLEPANASAESSTRKNAKQVPNVFTPVQVEETVPETPREPRSSSDVSTKNPREGASAKQGGRRADASHQNSRAVTHSSRSGRWAVVKDEKKRLQEQSRASREQTARDGRGGGRWAKAEEEKKHPRKGAREAREKGHHVNTTNGFRQGNKNIAVQDGLTSQAELLAESAPDASLLDSEATGRDMEESELANVQEDAAKHAATEKPMIRHELLERWWDSEATPTIHQRVFANKFFTGHPKKMLFSAGSLYQVSFTDVPEIAIMGRSNVGKSSIINALFGEGLAHTSKKPGKTKTLNAWAVGGMDRTGQKHKLTVLDMPGYGHGSREEWGTTVMRYLEKRKELKRVFLLVNSEHGLKDNDKEMLKSLRDAAIPHQVVFSKIDSLIMRAGPKKQKLNYHTLLKICAEANLRMSETHLSALVNAVQEESSRGGLPTSRDFIACSGLSGILPGEAPEQRGSLGISALRWAIVSAAGLQPQRRVSDEKDLSFS